MARAAAPASGTPAMSSPRRASPANSSSPMGDGVADCVHDSGALHAKLNQSAKFSRSKRSAWVRCNAHDAMRAVGAFAIAGKFNYHRASEPERRMAELKSIFEQIDPDEEAAAIAEAEAELDAGK